ncbi:hypothetical protein JOC55_006166 [Paenibacillus sacheonensis]|nr:hypothetical protein [Paenibacillus sacheonensis]
MSNQKNILFVVYGLIVLIIGVLLVPVKKVWGPAKDLNIQEVSYSPLWKLVDKRQDINGYHPIYELQIGRLLYSIFIVTLLFAIIYFAFIHKRNR